MPYDVPVHIDAVPEQNKTDRFGLQHLVIIWNKDGSVTLDGQMSVIRLGDKGDVETERPAPSPNIVLTPEQAKQIAADFDTTLAKLRAVLEDAYQANNP